MLIQDSVSALYKRAENAFDSENFLEAAKIYQLLLKIAPKNSLLLSKVVRALLKTEQHDLLLTYLDEAIRRNSSDAMLYNMLGVFNCVNPETIEKGIAALVFSLSIDPEYQEAQQNMTRVLQKKGAQEVKVFVLHSPKMMDSSKKIHDWLAEERALASNTHLHLLVLSKNEVKESDIKLFEKVMPVVDSPLLSELFQSREALFDIRLFRKTPFETIGMLSYYQDVTEALKRPSSFSPILNQDPGHHHTRLLSFSARYLGAKTLFSDRRFQEAMENVQQLLKADPDNLKFLKLALDCAVHLDDKDLIQKYLGRYVSLTVIDPDVCALTGQYFLAKFPFNALCFFAFGLSLEPEHEKLRALLNQVLESLGKKRLKIACVQGMRLGHLALEPSLWLKRQEVEQEKDPDTLFVILSTHELVSRTLVSLYQNAGLKIVSNGFFYQHFSLISKEFYQPLPYNLTGILRGSSGSVYGDAYHSSVYQVPSPLSFSQEELDKGKVCLEMMGLPTEPGKYVCIFARDANYLKHFNKEADWSYHDYRDFDINDYKATIDYLIDQGLHVVRVGSHTDVRLNYQRPGLIDYTRDWRHKVDGDFMDIFLVTQCLFYVGNYSGLSDVPMMLDTPTLIVNGAPCAPPYGMRSFTYLPKHMYKTDTGERLPYYELYEDLTRSTTEKHLLEEFNGHRLAKRGYEYRNNTPEEILEAVQEMLARVQGTFSLTKEDERLIENYFKLFPEGHYLANSPHPITLSFLKKNLNLFFADQALENS